MLQSSDKVGKLYHVVQTSRTWNTKVKALSAERQDPVGLGIGLTR